MNNPFSVKTPESLSAEDIAKLFIDVFSDFPRLLEPEHTFLHGTRGTGKSMMLRYLEPSVQLAAKKVSNASELSHYAIHIPIKKANYGLSELERLDGASYWLLSEHILAVHVVIHILESLESLFEKSNEIDSDTDLGWKSFSRDFGSLCVSSGIRDEFESLAPTREQSFKELKGIIRGEYNASTRYLRKLTFSKDSVPYENALFGYIDFLLPLVELVIGLDVTPSAPIYLMLDDADNLPARMQKVLNTWVSYRSTNQVCLKITTQQRYKTWRTVQDSLIESPHDYSEIDISTVYTSKGHSHYYNQVEKVVQKRLEVYGFCSSPEEFFPLNEKQKIGLSAAAKEIESHWEKGLGVSSRKNDDVLRYSVSEYMKSLKIPKKTNTFSYSGFRNMVDISSGVIRYFLEPASRMYNEVVSMRGCENEISSIPIDIQDRVLEDWSKEFMLNQFEGLIRTESGTTAETRSESSQSLRLRNLLVSFGNGFRKKLLSNDSERRYLSFMPTREVDSKTQEVLDLAIEWGYLYRSTIGRKEGIGRNTLYVLNRRLAPFFKLDPSGYAAHMSVTPAHLALAMENPEKFVREKFSKEDENSESHGRQIDLLPDQ